MKEKKIFLFCLLIALMSILILIAPGFEPARVHAQEFASLADQETCVVCHENLYFLHDTGNWFCIRESPMQCVDCHGGDPSSLRQQEAHASRKAHPVINEDASKCQECHPAECDERVAKFNQLAGINNVLIALPYQPRSIVKSVQAQQAQLSEPTEDPGWISAMEMITPILISALVLVIYLFHRRHQDQIKNRSRK
jgi:hypothetical protein